MQGVTHIYKTIWDYFRVNLFIKYIYLLVYLTGTAHININIALNVPSGFFSSVDPGQMLQRGILFRIQPPSESKVFFVLLFWSENIIAEL